MKKFDGNLNKLALMPHNIEFCYTSEQYYEMQRIIIITGIDGLQYDEYLVLEGGHCSCYDFDETDWDGVVWERAEFRKLAEIKSKTEHDKKEQKFWEIVLQNTY